MFMFQCLWNLSLTKNRRLFDSLWALQRNCSLDPRLLRVCVCGSFCFVYFVLTYSFVNTHCNTTYSHIYGPIWRASYCCSRIQYESRPLEPPHHVTLVISNMCAFIWNSFGCCFSYFCSAHIEFDPLWNAFVRWNEKKTVPAEKSVFVKYT